MNPNIMITDAASAYIKKMMEKDHGIGFRLTVKKTGCSGYSYLPTIVDKANANDFNFTTESGLQIYIDTAWIDMLQGLRIDFVEEDKSGLEQKRLVFTNPKET